MISRRILALTLALFGLAAGWAVALPDAGSTYGTAAPRIQVINASDPLAQIPEGAILVFNDDGVLDTVLRDQHSAAFETSNVALHPLASN